MPEPKVVPRLGARGLLLAALVAGVIVAAVAVSGQVDGPDGSCEAARAWHLKQALRYSQAEDQAYHVQAAHAAEEMATGCSGWDSDTHAPDANGDTSAGGLDGIQESQERAQAAQTA